MGEQQAIKTPDVADESADAAVPSAVSFASVMQGTDKPVLLASAAPIDNDPSLQLPKMMLGDDAVKPHGHKLSDQIPVKPHSHKLTDQDAVKPHSHKLTDQDAVKPHSHKLTDQDAVKPHGHKLGEGTPPLPHSHKLAFASAVADPLHPAGQEKAATKADSPANLGADGKPKADSPANLGADGKSKADSQANLEADGKPKADSPANLGADGKPKVDSAAKPGADGKPKPDPSADRLNDQEKARLAELRSGTKRLTAEDNKELQDLMQKAFNVPKVGNNSNPWTPRNGAPERNPLAPQVPPEKGTTPKVEAPTAPGARGKEAKPQSDPFLDKLNLTDKEKARLTELRNSKKQLTPADNKEFRELMEKGFKVQPIPKTWSPNAPERPAQPGAPGRPTPERPGAPAPERPPTQPKDAAPKAETPTAPGTPGKDGRPKPIDPSVENLNLTDKEKERATELRNSKKLSPADNNELQELMQKGHNVKPIPKTWTPTPKKK